jgi:cytochrome bd-type quinol oxidase subunit 2
MTHTEKVHVLFGLVAIVTGFLALWSSYHPDSRARLVWPILAFLIGFFLFIPVEAETRTYENVGWWETLRSFVPQHPETWVSDWLRYCARWHVVQHKIGSFLMMVVGVVEFSRANGRLRAQGWAWIFPTLLMGIAVSFGIHGGSVEHLPNRVEQVHHRVLGIAFAVAAVSLLLVRTGRLHGTFWQALWAMLVLVVGLDIALFYRLSPSERQTSEEHHHASVDPGMR